MNMDQHRIDEFVSAIENNNIPQVRRMLEETPEIINRENKVTILLLYYNAINISYIIHINLWVRMDGLLL